MDNTIKIKKIYFVALNLMCILALVIIAFPLLLVAQYNRPSADDWSYGYAGYRVIQDGGGIFAVLRAAIMTMRESYINWDSRFACDFLDSLQPGIWGERYYGVVAWILIVMLIVSEIYFCSSIICIRARDRKCILLCLPTIIPPLILQIVSCPSPVESFYWYTGGMNYTFMYCLSLILLSLFIKLGIHDYSARWKYIFTAVIACVLAVFVGGGNFSTSLSSFLCYCILTLLFLLYKNKSFLCKTWFVTLITGLSLALCIFAPGNMKRLSAGYGGKPTQSAVEAVVLSLVRSASNIFSWTNIRVMLMLLFILPFLWMAVKRIDFRFRYPALFTMLTFCLYASQVTPNLYVEGTTGPGRTQAILYYSYMVWLAGNVFYWTGWLSRRINKPLLFSDKPRLVFGGLIVYSGVVGMALVLFMYTTDLRTIPSYKAYMDWRHGYVQQYAAEWDARIEILRDDSVREVELTPLTVWPEVIFYTDLQDETGYYWVNDACAKYYGKEYVNIIFPESQ